MSRFSVHVRDWPRSVFAGRAICLYTGSAYSLLRLLRRQRARSYRKAGSLTWVAGMALTAALMPLRFPASFMRASMTARSARLICGSRACALEKCERPSQMRWSARAA